MAWKGRAWAGNRHSDKEREQHVHKPTARLIRKHDETDRHEWRTCSPALGRKACTPTELPSDGICCGPQREAVSEPGGVISEALPRPVRPWRRSAPTPRLWSDLASHFGSNSHPSREKRSSVSVANIGATHFGWVLFTSRALTREGSSSSGLRSTMAPQASQCSDARCRLHNGHRLADANLL